MACYHPLKAYARFDSDRKKRDIVFADSHYLPVYQKDGVLYPEKLLIPCGQCIGCRLEYSRQWAIRCVLEAKQWPNNYFLTLTYNDENLPSAHNFCVNEAGEVIDEFYSNPLLPDDLTKFLKNLRRQCEYHFGFTGIRFYACGEYGSLNNRPHYHIILFNMPVLNDLILYKKNFAGDCLYNSEFIDKIWDKGYTVIGSVSFDTCAYVARYMMKKLKGKDKDQYDIFGLSPEFSRCSRRPGIARSYYESEMGKIYQFDEICITDGRGKAKRVRPPQYFDRLYDVDNPDDLKVIKKKRQRSAEEATKKVLQSTSLSSDDYLALKEGNKIASLKKLTREL